ncbi:hypothetical protein, partial [Variovorax sp. SCN 67-20]|uniref:hypothetical protein n=1 Tax=Variovorax sp. SCN 67-20 TaxID=1660153 RepID=UPI0025CC7718
MAVEKRGAARAEVVRVARVLFAQCWCIVPLVLRRNMKDSLSFQRLKPTTKSPCRQRPAATS